MAYSANQVQTVIDKLEAAKALHQKQQAVVQAAKVIIDDNDDFSITEVQKVTEYVQNLRQKRDNLVAQVQPVVAAWVP